MNKFGIFMNFWEHKWSADHIYYINKVADLGYDILEFQAQPLLDMTDEKCRSIKAEADRRGIELTYSLGLDPKYDIASEDPEIRGNGIKYISNILKKISIMNGKLFSGVNYAGWGAPSYIVNDKMSMNERSVKSMKEIIKTAEDNGITFCVEAVNRFESALINTAKEALAYVKLVESPNMGVHLDTYHMNIEEFSIGDAIRLAGKELKHFHTGENNRTAPGRGHIDWREIAKALKDIKYQGRIVSEPFLMMGGEVGRDIKVWRDFISDKTEKGLDNEAKYLLEFSKKIFI